MVLIGLVGPVFYNFCCNNSTKMPKKEAPPIFLNLGCEGHI